MSTMGHPRSFIIALSIVAFMASAGRATTLSVPSDFATIQAGVDAAQNGDVVEIAPGIYSGRGNVAIDFGGRDLIVRSIEPNDPDIVATTIVDGGGIDRAFILDSQEPLSARVAGITIRNAMAGGGSAFRVAFNSAVTVSNCQIIDNFGGAVSLNFDSHIVMEHCLISGNTAGTFTFGGVTADASSVVEIYDSTISTNEGGLDISQSVLTLADSIVSDNASAAGAGVRLRFVPNATIARCDFARNIAAGDGGALWVQLTFGGMASVENCVFDANESMGSGGAIVMRGAGGSEVELLVVAGCTFGGNMAAEEGGAIYCQSESSSIRNVVLWGNEAPVGAQLALGPGVPDTPVPTPAAHVELDYAILQGGGDLVSLAGASELVIGSNILDVEPQLTSAMRLTAGSPAIDAGDPDFVPAPGATDIDGDPRVVGGIVDLGADEYLAGSFRRGDVNGDMVVDIADPILLLEILFVPGTSEADCDDAADANDDGSDDVADVIAILTYLFVPGTSPLLPPYPDCGIDPTSDALGCAVSPCP